MRNVFACMALCALLLSAPALAQEDDAAPYPDAPLGGLPLPEAPQTDMPADEAAKASAKPAESPSDDASRNAETSLTEQTVAERLDSLFVRLRRERDDAKALAIAAQIKTIWSRSGSATVDLLMQWATKAMVEKRYASALDFLNEAIALAPDYAEAWNRRATVYFLQKDYQNAMYDINRTLELEPRRFDALTSMATILRRTGLKQRALEAYQKALDVYPMMREVQKNYSDLADELTDTRT